MDTNVEYLIRRQVEAFGYFQLSDMRHGDKNVKSNRNIKGLNIFNHEFLYTAYADDITSFLKDKISVFESLNIFHKFSLVSGLSSNTTKCEIGGLVHWKG